MSLRRRPDWEEAIVDIHLRKLLWIFCPGHAGAKGNYRADTLAGKATITSGLLFGRSEVLRSLRHYLLAQSQGRHTIYLLEERDVERGRAGRSSLKGRERTILNLMNIGAVPEATLGKLQRDGMKRVIMCVSERIYTILNCIGLKRTFWTFELNPGLVILDTSPCDLV